MSYTVCPEAHSYVASGDLSACLNRVVQRNVGTNHSVSLAGAGAGFGVLQNAPRDGEDASVAEEGTVMVRVGAAVTAGSPLTSAASGWAIIQTAEGGHVFAFAETNAASGMLVAAKLKEFFAATTPAA